MNFLFYYKKNNNILCVSVIIIKVSILNLVTKIMASILTFIKTKNFPMCKFCAFLFINNMEQLEELDFVFYKYPKENN